MSKFNAFLGENELQGGAIRAVEAEGVPVLVSRSEGGEACTIANTYTHRGGPLNEANAMGTSSPAPGTVLKTSAVSSSSATGSGR